MTSRDEHLAWCKTRALALIDEGDASGAVASMLSDLAKWDGGAMYAPEVIQLLGADGMFFRKTSDQVRRWVDGFN